MGVPTSEVGYTSATTRREDHEVHKGHVVALERRKNPSTDVRVFKHSTSTLRDFAMQHMWLTAPRIENQKPEKRRREKIQIHSYGQNLQKMGCSHFRKQLIRFMYVCTTTVWTCFRKPEGHTFDCSEEIKFFMCFVDDGISSTLWTMCHFLFSFFYTCSH
jgi:hypothetical protein